MSLPSNTAGTAPALADASVARLTLDPVPASAKAAREFARAHVGADRESIETVLLLSSELVTNAVLHARSRMDLTVQVNDEAVLIAVRDCEDDEPEEKPQSTERLDGRGIALVAALATEWGSTAHDRGKTVWCVLDAAS